MSVELRMDDCLEIIDPIKFRGWDPLLSSSGISLPFVSSSWARVFYETYDYRPYYFCIIRNGLIEGLVPLIEVRSNFTGTRAVSLPFTDYCKPWIKDGDVFKELFSQIISFGRTRGWKYIELRGGEEWLMGEEASSSYYLHEIEISKDVKINQKLLRDSTRRNINKAKKAGVVVRKSEDLRDLKDFYCMHKNTRKSHGVPPQPFVFFENIYKHIISKGKGIVILAEHQNEIVAGALFLSFGDTAIYKYGASCRDTNKIRPNNLIMWEAIRWCSEHGLRSLNLGRTDLNSEGLLQYKRGWGCKESLLNYYRFDMKSGNFVVDHSGLNSRMERLFQLTPTPILTKFGEITYRHFG